MDRDIENIRGHTFFKSLIRENPTVVDVGANKGKFSSEFIKAYPSAKLLLIEANPELYKNLEVEFSELPNVDLIHCAAGSGSGIIEFHVANNDEGSSILKLPKKSQYDATLRHSVEVEMKSLSQLFEEHGIKHCDLLKVDIEGAEIDLLDGTKDQVLCNIAQMQIEFHSHPSFGFDLKKETYETIERLRKNFYFIDFSNGNKMDCLFVNKESVSFLKIRKIVFMLGLRRMYSHLRSMCKGTS